MEFEALRVELEAKKLLHVYISRNMTPVGKTSNQVATLKIMIVNFITKLLVQFGAL